MIFFDPFFLIRRHCFVVLCPVRHCCVVAWLLLLRQVFVHEVVGPCLKFAGLLVAEGFVEQVWPPRVDDVPCLRASLAM